MLSISAIVTIFSFISVVAANVAIVAYKYARLKKTADIHEEKIEKLERGLSNLKSSCREEFKPMGALSAAIESLNKNVANLEEYSAQNIRLKPIIQGVIDAVSEIEHTIKTEIFGRLRHVETDVTRLKTLREVDNERI